MYIYLTSTGSVFTTGRAKKTEEGLPSVVWENINYGDWNEVRSAQFNVTIPLVGGIVLSEDCVITDKDLIFEVDTTEWVSLGRNLPCKERCKSRPKECQI
jgi:hypothetical protein